MMLFGRILFECDVFLGPMLVPMVSGEIYEEIILLAMAYILSAVSMVFGVYRSLIFPFLIFLGNRP